MCILPSASAPVLATPARPACPAQLLGPQQRQELALEGLTATRPITHLAADYQVSRQFVYQQVDQARQALPRPLPRTPRTTTRCCSTCR